LLIYSTLSYIAFTALKSHYDYLSTFQGQAKQIVSLLVIPTILSAFKNTLFVRYIKTFIDFFGTYSLELYVLHMLMIGVLWDVAHSLYESELPLMVIHIVPIINAIITIAICKPMHKLTTVLSHRIIN